MTRTMIALFLSTVFFAAVPAFAQTDFSGDGSLTISADPAHPSAGQTVQLTAQSPLLDLADSAITWTVNGKSAGKGQSVTVTLGGVGSESNISVSVSGPTGQDSAQLIIIPTSIDLLWEASSYTPPLYRGRALPSPDSSIRLFAVPHFVQSNGTAVPASNIIFTWKVNGAVLQGDSGLGDSSAVIPAAILFGSDLVTVDAQSAGGSLNGEAQVSIRTADPQLALYEDSPLFGIMYHQATGAQSSASESEMSFVAVPYFAAAASPAAQNLAYDWTVNSASVTSNAQDPNEITIGAQNAGSAQIALSLSDPSDPFVSASGSWDVLFDSGSASSNNVFNSPAQ